MTFNLIVSQASMKYTYTHTVCECGIYMYIYTHKMKQFADHSNYSNEETEMQRPSNSLKVIQ